MFFATRFTRVVRCSSAVIAVLSLFCPVLPGQAPPASLQITIIDGEDAVNNIRQRTAREPIVQVEDENHKPVAGAVVVFLLPNDGPSGVFPNGSRSLTVTTDSKGQAIARGLRPNNISGRYEIRVQASYQGKTAQNRINQSNIAGAAIAAGLGLHKWVGVLIAGAVVATIVTVSSHGGATPPTNVPVAVIPTTGTVGPPR